MSDKTEWEKEIEQIIDDNFIDDEHTLVQNLVYKARQDERRKVVSEIREWIRILGEQSYASGVHAETAKVEILAELTDKLSAIEKEAGK